MNQEKTKTYDELMSLETFEDRFRYLMLNGNVGEDTFGFDRYLNQKFYKSAEWKAVRNRVIVRDMGCDLGVIGKEIPGTIYVHHMNPIQVEDIEQAAELLFDENQLICTMFETHNAIHYGDESYLDRNHFAERAPNDMSPWRK
jgi:hypothetical protein